MDFTMIHPLIIRIIQKAPVRLTKINSIQNLVK